MFKLYKPDIFYWLSGFFLIYIYTKKRLRITAEPKKSISTKSNFDKNS